MKLNILFVIRIFCGGNLSFASTERNSHSMDENGMIASNKIFLSKIFNPVTTKRTTAGIENVALSPVGVYFISSMVTDLVELELYNDWDKVATEIDLISFNNELVNDPLLTSKSIVAGRAWSDEVPAGFIMENFKVFDLVNVTAIEEFLETDVKELEGALNVAVHVLSFQGAWKTEFSSSEAVKFSDGVTYNFMQEKIPNVSWYEGENVQMVTIPFKGGEDPINDVVIDLIKSTGPKNFVNLKDHHQWLSKSEMKSEIDVVIPKIDVDFSIQLDLSPEETIDSLQKVKVKWDDKGVTAEAVSIVFSRSVDRFTTLSFKADRPFYFVIRKGDTWLFTGRINSIDHDINKFD